jgi:hypothetical protein
MKSEVVRIHRTAELVRDGPEGFTEALSIGGGYAGFRESRGALARHITQLHRLFAMPYDIRYL